MLGWRSIDYDNGNSPTAVLRTPKKRHAEGVNDDAAESQFRVGVDAGFKYIEYLSVKKKKKKKKGVGIVDGVEWTSIARRYWPVAFELTWRLRDPTSQSVSQSVVHIASLQYNNMQHAVAG